MNSASHVCISCTNVFYCVFQIQMLTVSYRYDGNRATGLFIDKFYFAYVWIHENFHFVKDGLSINRIKINFLSLEVSPYTLYQAFKNGILLWQVGKIYAYRVADMNCNMFVWKKTQQLMRWKSWMMRKSKMIEINCLLNYSTTSIITQKGVQKAR